MKRSHTSRAARRGDRETGEARVLIGFNALIMEPRGDLRVKTVGKPCHIVVKIWFVPFGGGGAEGLRGTRGDPSGKGRNKKSSEERNRS